MLVVGVQDSYWLILYITDAEMGMKCTNMQLYIAFEGQVALCDNEQSWVAKWLRIDGFQSGM